MATYATTGNWNKEYLNPTTTSQRATQLYNTFGSRYNWLPLDQRLASGYTGYNGVSPPTPTPTLTTPKPMGVSTIPVKPLPVVSAGKPTTVATQNTNKGISIPNAKQLFPVTQGVTKLTLPNSKVSYGSYKLPTTLGVVAPSLPSSKVSYGDYNIPLTSQVSGVQPSGQVSPNSVDTQSPRYSVSGTAPDYIETRDQSMGDINSIASGVGGVSSYLSQLSPEDAIYQYQLGEGQKALDRKLSAQGLLGSSAELAATRNLVSDLTSQQAQRTLENARQDQATQLELAKEKANYLTQNRGMDINRYGQDITVANLLSEIQEGNANRLAGLSESNANRDLTAQTTNANLLQSNADRVNSALQAEANRRAEWEMARSAANQGVEQADLNRRLTVEQSNADRLNSALQADANRRAEWEMARSAANQGVDQADLNRQMTLLQSQAALRQDEANRLSQLQQNEVTRQQSVGNTNWGRLMDLITQMGNLSPYTSGANASNSLANLYAQMGPQMVQYLLGQQ